MTEIVSFILPRLPKHSPMITRDAMIQGSLIFLSKKSHRCVELKPPTSPTISGRRAKHHQFQSQPENQSDRLSSVLNIAFIQYPPVINQ
jgi:hypothetical protein